MLNHATMRYIQNTPVIKRKQLGQFFTPKHVRQLLFTYLPKIPFAKVAELNVGTGEFISDIYEHFHNSDIYGYDIDSDVMNIAKNLYPDVKYNSIDSLYAVEDNFDFVVGNPPYIETTNNKYKKDFNHIISGRINLYMLFIYKGLTMLKDGGYLAMIVPTSMNNGAYFSKLREFITTHGKIVKLHILDSNLFIDAQQQVQIIVIQKGYTSQDYIFKRNNLTIFTELSDTLRTLWADAVSLKELGYTVKTGNVVWNQHKELLSMNKTNTLLLWAHNINNGVIQLSSKKPQYIKNWKPEYTSGILVNRITGANERAKIKTALYTKPFAAENHVNVISGDNLEWLLPKLTDVRSLAALKLITGNTQLSKTELENLFPIFEKGT